MDELRGLWRGKRVDNGELVQGFYSCITDNYTPRNVYYITTFQVLKNDEVVLTGTHEVDPSTLGECIRRRDRNGKPVFEGDVLRWTPVFHDSEKAYSSSFVYSESYLILVGKKLLENGITDMVSGNGNLLGTVYGNIYDNPELLKLFTADGIDKKGNK